MKDEIEKLSSEIHNLYCEEYKKRFGKEYHTKGDYSLLDEATKNYDRNIARWHLKKIEEERERCAKIADKFSKEEYTTPQMKWSGRIIAKAIREKK